MPTARAMAEIVCPAARRARISSQRVTRRARGRPALLGAARRRGRGGRRGAGVGPEPAGLHRGAAVAAPEHVAQCLAGVAHRVESVGDLPRPRRAPRRGLGVLPGAVARHDLGPRVGAQPGDQRRRLPSAQDVDGPARLEIDQQGRVPLAPPERDVVDPEHPRRGRLRRDRPALQAEQRVGADR
jgi:hypothetical protein